MTSLPSSSRSIRSQSLLPFLMLWVAIPVMSLTACADKHIGRPCDPGLPPGDPTTATVNAQALECPSRICLLPSASITGSDTGATCTDYCNTDDDCSDAEVRGSSSLKLCKAGFACGIAIGNVSNPIACKRVCICKDFLVNGKPDPKPPSCP